MEMGYGGGVDCWGIVEKLYVYEVQFFVENNVIIGNIDIILFLSGLEGSLVIVIIVYWFIGICI